MSEVRLEVRCCCDPAIVYGWVPVARDAILLGASVAFRLAPAETRTASPEFPDIVRLTVGEIQSMTRYSGDVRLHLALKSGDLPLSTLRRIPGFVEWATVLPELTDTGAPARGPNLAMLPLGQEVPSCETRAVGGAAGMQVVDGF